MMLRFATALALAAGLLAPGAPAAAQPVHYDEVLVIELLEDGAAYADLPITVQGELVGDFGRRDDGTVWAQLNGDAYAEAPLPAGGERSGPNAGIGLQVPAGAWPDLDRPGGYRLRGPLVEASGIWRYHDPGRGGESYLEVSAMRVLESPVALEEGPSWVPIGLGAGFLAAAGLLSLRRRRPA